MCKITRNIFHDEGDVSDDEVQKLRLLCCHDIHLVICAQAAYSQRDWRATNGPFGGIVASFASMPDGTLLVVAGFGVYRSLDNAESWHL